MAANETQEKAKPLHNNGAPNVPYFVPVTTPSPGTLLSVDDFPQNKKAPKSFQTLKIRDVEFKNRIWVSSMCQYSCASGTGVHTHYHQVHLGQFALGGAGYISVEASSVTPNGLISPEDSGIWGEEHIEPLKKSVDFAHTQGAKIGIQLAHAGRKASTWAPWLRDGLVHPHSVKSLPKDQIVPDSEHGWGSDVVGPSAIPFDPNHATPKELSVQEIKSLIQSFADAAERAERAGFDVVEIHAAHGYGMHNFLSPLSNQRTDEYGGSLENRMRFVLEITRAVRAKWPAHKPVFVRISASDHHEKGEKDAQGNWISWGIEQSIELVKALQKEGIELIDVSSGGNYAGQKFDLKPGYQVPFSAAIKKAVPTILTGAVGLLTDGKQIEGYLEKGEADAAFLAREFLRDPHFPYTAAGDLGVAVSVPPQYERAYTRLYKEHA